MLATTRSLVIKPKRIDSNHYKYNDTAFKWTNRKDIYQKIKFKRMKEEPQWKASDRHKNTNANKVMHHKYICHSHGCVDSHRSSASISVLEMNIYRWNFCKRKFGCELCHAHSYSYSYIVPKHNISIKKLHSNCVFCL